MHKRYPVTLTDAERDPLKRLIATGTESARKLTHARILLKADPNAAARPPSFARLLLLTSWKDSALFAASQAGLVNNLNDGMAWGLFPLYFAAAGLRVERIGLLAAMYTGVWGIS